MFGRTAVQFSSVGLLNMVFGSEFSMGWVDLSVGLGWAGLRFFSCWCVGSTMAKVIKILKGLG